MEVKGQLVQVRPVSAHLLHNTGLFTQKHPICEVQMGEQKMRTVPCWHKGSRPTWTENFSLIRTDETQIHFCILNRSKFGIRHLVAEGDFYFLEQPAALFESHVKLMNGEKEAGELIVLISMVGSLASVAGFPDSQLYPQFVQPAPIPQYVIVKQQPLDGAGGRRKGHHGSRKSKRVREVFIIPETQYLPQS